MSLRSLRFVSVAIALLAIGIPLTASDAQARPSGPLAFCSAYPASPHCAGSVPSCKLCHTDTGETTMGWNAYGNSLFDPLIGAGHTFDDASFATLIASAVVEVEGEDQDQDGLSTLEEIVLGTQPGDVASTFAPLPPPTGDANPAYSIGEWDAAFAYRRVAAAFCGASPSYEEMQALADADDTRAAVHTKLEECVATSFWRDTALPRIADTKIRPIDRFVFWDWDYRLWRWGNLDHHDARELLTAQYHVREIEPGVLTRADTLPNQQCTTTAPGATECQSDQTCNCPKQGGECTAPGVCVFDFGGQPCQTDKRAGMLTTQWFHFSNTMFSALPRTTAAQAMRSFLDLDPAAQEGLVHVDDEPKDVDEKNVTGYTCRQCHMAVDTAAYAFAEYQGIGGGGASTFNENRPFILDLWTPSTRPQAYFLDQPVSDLVEWAQVAANSDYFARQQASTFFQYAVGREPEPNEEATLDAIWRAYKEEDAYSTQSMLHRIIDTDAFGCP